MRDPDDHPGCAVMVLVAGCWLAVITIYVFICERVGHLVGESVAPGTSVFGPSWVIRGFVSGVLVGAGFLLVRYVLLKHIPCLRFGLEPTRRSPERPKYRALDRALKAMPEKREEIVLEFLKVDFTDEASVAAFVQRYESPEDALHRPANPGVEADRDA